LHEVRGKRTYDAVWWEAVSVRRADLTVLPAWSAGGLTDLQYGWVLGKRGDGHGEAKGEGGESRELHFGMLEVRNFEIT
jgi:hypothetical protein